MDRTPRPGEFYRHFKNKLYQVKGIAVHSETGEKMVVYQALYGDYGLYVRPLSMFVSPVDREKYPDAAQEYRFQRVDPVSGQDLEGKEGHGPEPEDDPKEQGPSPLLMAFLEADGIQKQLVALRQLEPKATQRDLDCIYAVLELQPEGESIGEQVENIRKFLSMQQRFDGRRLREGR